MSDEDVMVVAVGMVTSVGLSAAETAASVRAGTMRFTEVPWRDQAFEPFTLAEVPGDGLPDLVDSLAAAPGLTARERRMLRLGTMPLAQCRGRIGGQAGRIGLDLALPDRETLLPLDRPALVERLARQTDAAFDIERSDATAQGRAGGLVAVGQAARRIRDETATFALAGAVDTYRDSYLLGILDQEQRVKSSAHSDGFIPGEGGGFLLLAGRAAAKALGIDPLARITPVYEAFEEGHLYSDKPYRGEGLADALAKLLEAGDVEDPIQEVYSSMNGENHWAKEWGVAFLRNKDAFAPEHRLHHPADCFGDTGAACGPLLIGLAAWGIAQGYRQSPSLVLASSDRGARAVLAVSRP